MGLSPLDIMQKSKAVTTCDICDEDIAVWADATGELASQVADAYVMHLFDEHVDNIDIDFDNGAESALELLRYRNILDESGRVTRYDGDFVIDSGTEDENEILI